MVGSRSPLSFGVVHATAGRSPSRGHQIDSYLTAHDGRVRWLDGTEERHGETAIHGHAMLAIATGEADSADAAREAAVTATRVLVRLYEAGRPYDPLQTLAAYLDKAHERIRGRLVAHEPRGASLAMVWWLAPDLVWAEIGACCVRIYQSGEIRRPGPPSATARAQRLMQQPEALYLRPGVNLGIVRPRPGERFLLLSHGLRHAVDPASLTGLLRDIPSPQTAVVSAVDKAIARGRTGPMTAILTDLDASTLHTSLAPSLTLPPARLRSLRSAPTEP